MKRLKAVSAAAALCACSMTAGAQTMEDAISIANTQLANSQLAYRIAYAEYLTLGESAELGREVFAKDVGNKQLGADFVPGDPRRIWNSILWSGLVGPTDISTGVDDVDVTQNLSAGNTLQPGEDLAAFHTVNGTWDAVECSDIDLVDIGDSGGFDAGVVQASFGFGGSFEVPVDIAHAGMVPPAFFDAFACGAPGSGCGNNILGVAFTFIWLDEAGNPTDVDRNRKLDVAFREIYYNDRHPWQDNPKDQLGDGAIDLESVALHEMGHGLSQAHFGTVAAVDRNRDGFVQLDEIQVSPQAVMNAIHTVAGRTVEGTDLGGHCSNWGQWPRK